MGTPQWPNGDKMITSQQQTTVEKYKKETIIGKCVDFAPVSERYLPDVVRLRNQDRSKYFLNQPQSITLEDQKAWFAGYRDRKDDIYWAVLDKEGTVVGTIRLYNIDEGECEHGSCIVDEQFAGMPYALEIMIFSIEFAFNQLGVRKINGNVRKDNDSMNSIIRRMGFKVISPMDIRGVEYVHNELVPEDSKVDRYKQLLDKYVSKRS